MRRLLPIGAAVVLVAPTVDREIEMPPDKAWRDAGKARAGARARSAANKRRLRRGRK